MQIVVKEAGYNNTYPLLTQSHTPTNEDYNLLVNVKLESCRYWDTTEYGDANRRDDRLATEAIMSVVPRR